MSYGEREKAYQDEFERQGFEKSGGKWIKKESVREGGKGSGPQKGDKRGDYDVGGPAHANVPKGAKTSKQAKAMKAREKNMEKTDDMARSMGFKHTAEIVKDGNSDELQDFMDAIEDRGQDFNQAEEYLNLIRDDEMGVTPQDDDVIMSYRKHLFKALSTPGVKGKGSGKSAKETGDEMMKASDAANKKMEKENPETKAKLDKAYKKFEKYKKELMSIDYHPIRDKDKPELKKKRDDLMKRQKDYYIKVVKPLEKKLNPKESIGESRRSRRCTVKEVRMWMKKLEENRYKKVYNSDARRVSWMVNNEGIDLQEMPVSMRKKWTKAQYGRERYLAREFTKHLESKQITEWKLRKAIRKIIKEIRG